MNNLIKTYDDTLDVETCNNLVSKFEQFENLKFDSLKFERLI